ncbi:hypothetical protein N9T15_01485 [Pelagibacteraceae bacterium]|nr:hypothetical protein [Pelagibacteraceae bacterium]
MIFCLVVIIGLGEGLEIEADLDDLLGILGFFFSIFFNISNSSNIAFLTLLLIGLVRLIFIELFNLILGLFILVKLKITVIRVA